MENSSNYTVLIADDDREHMRTIKEYVLRMGIFKNYEIAFNGKDALRAASELKPDLLICSVILQDIDGFGVVYKTKQLFPNIAAVLSSSIENDFAIRSSFANGADMLLIKPCEYDIFDKNIRLLLENRSDFRGTIVRQDSPEKKLITDITREIQRIGVSAGIKGFKYVRHAIYLYMQSEAGLSVMNEIYPAVAEKFDTTPACVERNIRHALESAWTRGSLSYIEEVFGFTVDADKGKPTNSAFIATVAEQVKLKNMI